MDSLVSTKWLNDNLQRDDVIVLSAALRLPGAEIPDYALFDQCHIDQAIYFDIDEISDKSANLPHMMPSADQFARQVGALGIGDDHHIVVYDRFGLLSAARVWWMFKSFGHDKISILDGGLPKWMEDGYAVTDKVSSLRPSQTFTPKATPRLRDIMDIQTICSQGGDQILDARDRDRFEGTGPDLWPGCKSGHIPGSLNMPFTDLLNEDRTLRPPHEIKRLLKDSGLDLDRPVITSCGSGITACILNFAMHLIGKDDTALYDGSWAEWGAEWGAEQGTREDTQVAVGPSQKEARKEVQKKSHKSAASAPTQKNPA